VDASSRIHWALASGRVTLRHSLKLGPRGWMLEAGGEALTGSRVNNQAVKLPKKTIRRDTTNASLSL